MAKAKITRIKAGDHKSVEKTSDQPVITRKKVVIEDKKATKNAKKADKKAKKAEKRAKKKKSGKKPFILFRPFCALGRYIRDSWREIRQVRWPNRKTTWKMVIAVIVYTAIFIAFITLMDALLTLIFNNFLK
ncbi:preprotein translocase subunit SecE [Candidatus Saccharibacteria bacterium]|nr:preprotein translocase subunit SecE [Candidatus Saccharibacteria bacterium]